jgi:hypothetical protein
MPPIDNPDKENGVLAEFKAIEPLLAAFEAVCRSLQVPGPNDPLAEIVALKVIEIARSGERDPDRIHDQVLLALRNA